MLIGWIVDSLATEIDRLLDSPKLKGAVVAVCIRDQEGKTVYERNADLLMTPGSNQKLLTAAFALARLGPEYSAQTKFWKFADKVVVDAPGDPSMTRDLLLRARMALGIQSTTPVHVRQAYRPGVPPSWEFDDLPHKYAAQITAFTVDHGSFELWAEKGQIELTPRSFGIDLRVVDDPAKPQVAYDPSTGTLTVTGKLPEKRTRLETLALPFPDRAAAWTLAGPFTAVFEVPTTPPDVVIASRSIGNIVSECLTQSDNHFAEHLLLMAAQEAGPLGKEPYVVAAQRLTSFLLNVVGISAETVRPEDGSGLSRHNLVSARALTDLLLWTQKQPFGNVFQSALAAPGTGTLKARLAGIDFRGKTGTLELVSALSGYLSSKSGKKYVVSIVFNQFKTPVAGIHEIQDKILSILAGNGTNHASTSEYASRASLPRTGIATLGRIP